MPGIGEHREAPGEAPRDDLDDGEADGKGQHDREGAARCTTVIVRMSWSWLLTRGG